MSIIASISRIAMEYRQARSRASAERAVRALPPELQKDIGWPDAYVSGGVHLPAGCNFR